MGRAHENWSRVWMTHFYEGSGLGLNLDWPKVSGTFVSSPHDSEADCLRRIAEINPPPAKKKMVVS